MLRKLGVLISGFMMICGAALPLHAKEAAVMRIHHVSPPNHQITMALHLFAQEVEERTKGHVVVDIVTKRTGRPTVEHTDYVSAVSSGAIEAASMPTFMWTDIPEMNFSMIPYYFTSAEQIRKFPDSAAAHMLNDKIKAKGLRTLAWLHVTRTSVFTSNDKPLLHPADFSHLKIVAINRFGEVPFQALGADPVIIYSPDIHDAVRDGKASAVVMDVSSATGLRLSEVQKYGTITPYFSAFYHLFVNPKWLDGLPQKDRKAVLLAARHLEQNAFLITEARAAAAPDVLREGGMTLHIQTPEETAEWKKAMMQPALDAFIASSPDAARLIDAVNKIH